MIQIRSKTIEVTITKFSSLKLDLLV